MTTVRTRERAPAYNRLWPIAISLTMLVGLAASAQDTTPSRVTLSDQMLRAPRFLLSTSGGFQPVDIPRSPSLTRRITLEIAGVTVREAIREVARRGGLTILFTDDVGRLDAPAKLHATDITVAAALTDLLIDAGVDIVLTKSGAATLCRRDQVLPAPAGTVAGRVTNAERGTPCRTSG